MANIAMAGERVKQGEGKGIDKEDRKKEGEQGWSGKRVREKDEKRVEQSGGARMG